MKVKAHRAESAVKGLGPLAGVAAGQTLRAETPRVLGMNPVN